MKSYSNEKPLFFLFTCVKDGRKYINKLFDSLLSQTKINFVHYIYEDGSNDPIEDLVLSYKEKVSKLEHPYKVIYDNKDVTDQVNVNFSIENETVKGMVVSESREGVVYLEDVVNRMAQKSEISMDVRVIIGKEIQTFGENGNISETYADNNNVDTASLYKLAKSFLKEYSSQP